MRKRMLILPLLLVIGAAPAFADEPVMPRDLSHFVGYSLHGYARTTLGTVSDVDKTNGLVELTGRHGEVALIHVSAMRHNGVDLMAPRLTIGDINEASDANLQQPGSAAAIIHPSVTVTEPTGD